MNKTENINKFNLYVKDAVTKIQRSQYEESFKIIIKALKENPNAPEPQNLLGIWYEFKGNRELARKHYRAAYALDPTYKPASKNLERVSTLFSAKNILVDFGENYNDSPQIESSI